MGKNKKSFTFIELMIVVSVIILFSTIIIPQFNSYNQRQKLKNDATKLIDVIELAKKKAIVSDLYDTSCSAFNGYRVTVNGSSYILKFVCAGAYQDIQTYDLQPNISVISGTGNFDFPPLGVNINLSINSIRLKNSIISQCLDISLSSIGIISVNNNFIGC